MLNVKIRSYDPRFDTYHIRLQETDGQTIESLIPALLLPYIAHNLIATLDSLPYDAVGREFNLKPPAGALTSI